VKKFEICLASLAMLLGSSPAWSVSYQFIKVADTTTQATPTQPIRSFNWPVDIDDGVAVISVNWSLSRRGLFTGSGGALTKIAQNGDSTPIGALPAFSGPPSINGGAVAFDASGPNTGAIFLGSGGPLAVIAKEGDPAPTGNFVGFSNPQIAGDSTAFIGLYRNFLDSGVFLFADGALSTVVKTGDPAPTGAFTTLGGVAFDGQQIAFIGQYGGADEGVFLVENDVPRPLALAGDAAPDGVFTDFFYYLSMRDGTVAFNATFGPSSEQGIFTSNGGPLTTVVKTNDPAPRGVFDEVGRPFTNGATTAFLASYNDANDQGIFTGNGGPLDKVIAEGEPLFGSEVLNFASTDSSAVGIDAQGNIAFYYRLIDGREGVAIARPVPEPATAVGLVVSALVCVCMGQLSSLTKWRRRESNPRPV
jgi:hypothetical protein